jgi:hypothetical protein
LLSFSRKGAKAPREYDELEVYLFSLRLCAFAGYMLSDRNSTPNETLCFITVVMHSVEFSRKGAKAPREYDELEV